MNVNTRKSFWSNRVRCMTKAYAAGWLSAIATLAIGLAVFAPNPGLAQSRASDVVTVCVVVPHFKDEYWLSVGFGLMEQAEASSVSLRVFESGGYHALARQIELLDTCVATGAQAILLGAVSADNPLLLAAVQRAAQTVPVLALVNELHSEHLAASIGVDWRKMGANVGHYLAGIHPLGSPPMRAALITGPTDSGWSPLLESGLTEALAGSSVKIVVTRHADTGLREQLREVEGVLASDPRIDYLIGSAPATEGAMGLAVRAQGRFPKLIATYISHSVRRGLQNGRVLAVPFDDPVQQGRLGIQAALKALSEPARQFVTGPTIRLIQSGTPQALDIDLSPASFFLDIE